MRRCEDCQYDNGKKICAMFYLVLGRGCEEYVRK
jgi:hypothetical protein